VTDVEILPPFPDLGAVQRRGFRPPAPVFPNRPVAVHLRGVFLNIIPERILRERRLDVSEFTVEILCFFFSHDFLWVVRTVF
jgi:hypothetical protein